MPQPNNYQSVNFDFEVSQSIVLETNFFKNVWSVSLQQGEYKFNAPHGL